MNMQREDSLDRHCEQTASAKKLNFYIFGHNISHSLSPKIHNAAFKKLNLPHHYSIHQTASVDESVRQIIRSPDFGGASVTFPHKLDIGNLLDTQSETARLIGAVNTIVVEGNCLRGDNTDWIGILKVIGSTKPTSCIVLGAGGAARAAIFALQSLGAKKVTVVNRTRKNAEKLLHCFPLLDIQVFSTLNEAPAANVIIGCVPADDIVESDIPNHIFSNTGVVVEMSYRPPMSALMKVAQCQSGWKVAGGVDVLKEQAYAQFELWTGQEAPVAIL